MSIRTFQGHMEEEAPGGNQKAAKEGDQKDAVMIILLTVLASPIG